MKKYNKNIERAQKIQTAATGRHPCTVQLERGRGEKKVFIFVPHSEVPGRLAAGWRYGGGAAWYWSRRGTVRYAN